MTADLETMTPIAHRGLTLWFTGLSGAGKSTLAREVYRQLQQSGLRVQLLDGDEVRRSLSRDLGYTQQDREENVRRIAYVAALLTANGIIPIVAAMSPYRAGRSLARKTIGEMLEIFVDAPLAVCEQRDPSGLYRRFHKGEIHHMNGLDEPYETPDSPDVHCRTAEESVIECAGQVIQAALQHLGTAHGTRVPC